MFSSDAEKLMQMLQLRCRLAMGSTTYWLYTRHGIYTNMYSINFSIETSTR